MLPMSLQTANSTTGASRAATPSAAVTATDFASLLPTAEPAAADMAGTVAEPGALPVRANIIDIAGIAASATRAADQAGASEMFAQGVATTPPQAVVVATEQMVAAAVNAKPAPSAAQIVAAAADEASDAVEATDATVVTDKPGDTSKGNAKAPAADAVATDADPAPPIATDAAPVPPAATIAPVIAAAPQVTGATPAPAADPAAAPTPIAAGMAAMLTLTDGNKQTNGKAPVSADLPKGDAGANAGTSSTELSLAAGSKAASSTRDAANQTQILTFADLRDKLRIGQPEASPSLLVTQSNPLQATAGLPLAAVSALAQPKFDGTLDMSQSSLWLDQLAHDIASTVDKKGDLRFRLMPAQLGEMTVQMRIGDNGMALRMETRSEDASRLISAHQSHLSDELRRQGIHVASTDISHSENSTGQRGQEQLPRNPDFPFWSVETGVANDEQDTHTPTPARRGRFA